MWSTLPQPSSDRPLRRRDRGERGDDDGEDVEVWRGDDAELSSVSTEEEEMFSGVIGGSESGLGLSGSRSAIGDQEDVDAWPQEEQEQEQQQLRASAFEQQHSHSLGD